MLYVKTAALLGASVVMAGVDVSSTRPIRVSCIGDSITVAGSNSSMTYPAQMQRVLGSQYEVTNFGDSGHTMLKNGLCSNDHGCGGDCSYWNTDIYKAAVASNPDIVTIMLGTNDAKHCNFDVQPADWKDPKCVGCPVQGHGHSFEADYLDMIRLLKALPTKPKVFVAVPPPLFPPYPYNMSAQVINEVFPVLIRKIGSEADGVIDAWSSLAGADPVRSKEEKGGHCGSTTEDCTRDGCHPQDAGLGILAQTFAWTVEAAVQSMMKDDSNAATPRSDSAVYV